MSTFSHWACFFLGSFAGAYATMYVWGWFEIMSFALVAGTLAAVIVTLAISFAFWSDKSVCDYCFAEAGR